MLIENNSISGRLSRSDWLALTLRAIETEGDGVVRIDKLCGRFNVSKGSFYAHFENREDFIDQLLLYWQSRFTDQVTAEIEVHKNQSPELQILNLMRLIVREGRTSVEATFRSWATFNPVALKYVTAVDNTRYTWLRQRFERLGFNGEELHLRVALLMAYETSFATLFPPPSELSKEDELLYRWTFFVRR
jgi:AcrR family transcriptional regulator